MTDTQTILANYETALAKLAGSEGEPNSDDMAQIISACKEASAHHPAARAKFATLLALGADMNADAQQAAEAFVEAAMSGMPQLLRELGVVLLITNNSSALAGALLKKAYAGGDWIAAFIILREASRGRYLATIEELTHLTQILSPAVPFKEDITNAIAGLEPFTPPAAALFKKTPCVDAALTLAKTAYAPTPSALHDDVSAKSFQRVLSPLECDYLIAIASQVMQPSKVVDASVADSIGAHYRTSDGGTILPIMFDFPLIGILNKLAAAADLPVSHAEFPAMLRYRPGQEYHPHHDYLEEDQDDYSKVKACGQRAATLLTYLNDGYEGGETSFPDLNVSYKGNAGDCLYFRNTDLEGTPIPASLHAGVPVTSGEKWLATSWFREKPFWSWER